MLTQIIARLNEPSTHAGLAALCLVAATFFPPYAVYLQAAAAVFGGAGVLKKEGK